MQDKIIKTLADAEATHNAIVSDGRNKAARMLEEAGVWVEEKQNPKNWFWKRVSALTCGSPQVRGIVDFLLGDARECYCCSAIRLGLYGFVLGLLVMYVFLGAIFYFTHAPITH